MSEVNIGIAVKASKGLESKLSQCFYADGKGLHEKISSVEANLPHSLIKKMRYVASIRNKVVHEDNYQIDDIEKFKAITNEALAELERIVTLAKKQACAQSYKQPQQTEKSSGSFLPQIMWLIVIGVLLSMCS